MIIEVNGQQIEVDDSFAELSEEEQQAQLQEIVASLPPQQQPSSSVPKYAPAAGAILGGTVGAAAGPTISKTAADVSRPVLATVPKHSVQKWLEATSDMPFAGGKDMSTAYQKAEIAAGKPFQSRGTAATKSPIRRGPASIQNQPAPPSLWKNVSETIGTGSPAGAPSKTGSALRFGSAGSFAGRAAQDFEQGEYGEAAVQGAGALTSLAGQSRFKPLRILGTGLSAVEALRGVNDIVPIVPKKPEEKANGGLAGYSKGNLVKEGVDIVKKAFTPKQTKIVRASEALGPHEGKWLNTTQSDRMRSTGGDLGGPGFSRFQTIDPRYEGAAWGVGKPGTATAIVNTNKRYPEGQAIWAPMIGSETQHHSNQHVFDALTQEFNRQAKLGKLTPELREKMNSYLMTNKEYAPLFKKGIDLGDPQSIAQMGDTFDRRGAIASVISGKGVGGQKGQIVDYQGIMQDMTDPMTIGSPTHAVGTRLFSLNNQIEYRPDLHSAFPYILKGDDMGVAFNPVPKELAIPDWMGLVRDFKGREPGYMDYTRGLKGKGTPFQFIDDKYLRALEAAGHKEGGPIGYAGGKAVKKGFENTVKAYKLFRTDDKGNLYPLFVNANKPVPVGEWLKAEAGPLTEAGKVKSKIGELAYRPGWHSGEYPVATHIGGKSTGDLKAPDYRPPEQVWAEVEHPADIDWQAVAMERAQKNKRGEVIPRTAHITDQIPFGGNYRYKTNPNMTGDWIISGDMKVNRVLPDEEVMRINEAAGVFDLPRFQPLDKKAEGGLMCLKAGGHSSPAWQRKEGKNPEGGLNAAGRASYNRETGGNLKPPVSAEQAKKSPKSAARRKSFCARMSGMEGPMKDEKGRPTRKALALRKWDC